MFYVYKITNKINNKCYIGSTSNYEVRWQSHKEASQQPAHQCYNYPLQRAFRKYGINNFIFEIIKDNFETRYDAEEYEKTLIIQYQALCSQNGYNQRLDTHGGLTDENRALNTASQSHPCALVDINENIIKIYPSYIAAAREHNLNSQVGKVCKGQYSSANGLIFRDLDENGNVVHIPKKPFGNQQAVIAIDVFNPKTTYRFESLEKAAKHFNTSRQEIYKCASGQSRYSVVKMHIFRFLDPYDNIILNEIDIEEVIKKQDKKYPLINGQRLPISDWCKQYNIKTDTYYARIRRGKTPKEALGIEE